MEFKSRVLEFTYDGNAQKLRFPNVGEIRDFIKKSEKENADSFDEVISFLVSLGLEKGLAEKMQVDHLKQVIDTLVGEKKS
jgi:hypothetical protein